jgi:hypothetical protein
MEQTQLLDHLALFSVLSVKAYLTSRAQLPNGSAGVFLTKKLATGNSSLANIPSKE